MTLFIILGAVLLLAVINDLRFQRIPNWLTFAAILSGIALNAAAHGFTGFLLSTAGALLGIMLLIFFYFLGGMGGGDVKLMGAVGALLGPKDVFVAFLATALIGGIYALILLAFRRQLSTSMKRYWLILKTYLLTRRVMYIPPPDGEKQPRLRYGVAIAMGTIISVVMKNDIYGILHLN